MKTKKILGTCVAALMLLAIQTLDAAQPFGASQSITLVDSFREAHPLLMGLFNIGGIILLVGICASAYSMLSKDSPGR
jgi:Mn2+/Fe2+ NRAMP family transporter